MSTNEFDKLIVDKFDQHEFAFKPAQWEKLSKELGEPTNEKKTIPLTGGWMKTAAMAACIVAIVSVFAWLYTGNKPEENNIAVNRTEQTTPATITHHQTIAKPQEHIQSSAPVAPTQVVNSPIAGTQKTFINTVQRNNHPQQPVINNTANNNVAISNISIGNNPIANNTTEHPTTDKKIETPETAISFQPNKGYTSNCNNNNIDLSRYVGDEPMPQRAKQSNTSFGLTGGMNYGSLSTGYVAGVTARKKVAGKVFVEGDLAFVSNKADQASMSETAFNVSTNGDVNNLGTSGFTTGSASSVKSATVEATSSNFNYLQFTPSVGYQVVPKISLSVGADFQRLLGYDDGMKTIVYENAQTKLAPSLDVGVTGRTEIAVSRKIKAGLLYREGVNNMVRGSASKQYLERRYLQVQLKFTVFDKK